MKLTTLAAFGLSSSLLIGATVTNLINPGEAWANSLNNPNNSSEVLVAQSIAKSGSFVTTEQDHPTTGTAKIITENGQTYLEFDQAFDTATGPDVLVVLHRQGIVPVNLNEEDYITLAPLKSFSGSQRYPIPSDLNLNDFQSVAIWCREFNVTFGYAAF